MSALKGYQISIIGMPDGSHSYTYNVGAEFFQHFDNQELQQGRFEVRIDLDKQQEMFILNFEINGSLDTECDRCMADISLPITGQHQLIIKLTDEEATDPDIEHISPDVMHLDVDQPIYEHILMSLPMVNVYDCDDDDPRPCDDDALDALEETAKKGDSGIWDALKNLEVDN